MAKQTGEVKLVGTYGNICCYEMKGEHYARLKSSLTGKRVKKDPRFRRTMEYAGWLKQASRLGSDCYQSLPKEERAYPMYRAMVGMAMGLLKMGKHPEEIAVELEKEFAVVVEYVEAEKEFPEVVMEYAEPKKGFPEVAIAAAAPLPRLYVNNAGQLVSAAFHNDWVLPIHKCFTPHNRIPRVLRC